jgi:hypothetical protein
MKKRNKKSEAPKPVEKIVSMDQIRQFFTKCGPFQLDTVLIHEPDDGFVAEYLTGQGLKVVEQDCPDYDWFVLFSPLEDYTPEGLHETLGMAGFSKKGYYIELNDSALMLLHDDQAFVDKIKADGDNYLAYRRESE